MSRTFRLVCAGMTVLFLSWAYFQLNDPDFEPWVAIYLVTALLSAATAAGRPLRGAALGVFGVCALWALIVLVQAFGTDITLFFEEVPGELWRESFGLLITAAWLFYLERKASVKRVFGGRTAR